jgi:hypothetical protein
MAELNLEKINNNMYGLVQIQKEMLTILRASSTAMKAQSKAMETLGESAKETTKQVGEVETILTRFIGTGEKGFLRRTTGGAGFFHKMMYGVPGYFIFKNRMDGLLSGIDKFVLKPLAGGNRDGFMAKVLYGVGGSFRKSKSQIEALGSLVTKGMPKFQGPAPRGGFRNPNTGRFESRPKLNLMTWITTSKLGVFISKSMSELKKQGKWNRFKQKLSAKGKSFFKFIKSGALFFASALLVMAKLGVAVLGGLIVLFFIVKALKRLGVSASFFEEWGRNILEFIKQGISMVGAGVGKMAEGIGEIYSAIFGDGDINDLLGGFFKTAEGLLEVFGGLILIILSPLLALIQTTLEAIYDKMVQNAEQIYMGFAKLLMIIGLIAAGVAFILVSFGAIGVLVAAAPYLIVAGIIGAIGILVAAINPFANGGVTKSGLSLVGERGPELVRLPKGSRVHSNQESRRMMSSGGNNITVNINGRVGSSDSELRIIAQKVGKMINKEINRTTSSRSLGA